MTKTRTFTIDPSKWRCGGIDEDRDTGKRHPSARGLGRTRMLNREGYMCCLGQIAKQCGFSDEQLYREREPEDVVGREKVKSSGFLTQWDSDLRRSVNTDLSRWAMNINDDDRLTDERRERLLTELFHRHECALKFTGRYVKKP